MVKLVFCKVFSANSLMAWDKTGTAATGAADFNLSRPKSANHS